MFFPLIEFKTHSLRTPKSQQQNRPTNQPSQQSAIAITRSLRYAHSRVKKGEEEGESKREEEKKEEGKEKKEEKEVSQDVNNLLTNLIR